MEDLTLKERNQALFVELILTFQQAAWQQLGKIPNPATQKIQRDLDQARHFIDMLDMIKTRMKDNLEQQETKMLEGMLRDLKLNYVDELDRSKKEQEKKPEEQATKEEAKPDSAGQGA